MTTATESLEALPDRSRLLHVGLMKTGTTALQSTASRRREALAHHGVLYPGSRYNHRREAQALFRRTAGAPRGRGDSWDSLMAEVDADQHRRVLISNEMIANAEQHVVQQLLDDLGPRTHVVLTVRSFGAVLPSLWQQYVKSGHRDAFADFLALRLTHDGPVPTDMASHDQAAIVGRWVDVFGADNVTVIVVDKQDPRRITSSFEALLDLPPGMLHDPTLPGKSLNRSLSVHEASLLLAVNRLLADKGLTREDKDRLLFKGVTARMLDEGSPPGPDDQLRLPPWAVEPAAARSRAYADAIAGTGVRVVGDLDELNQSPGSERGQHELSTMIPVQVAAQAVLGAISAGLDRGSDFAPRPPATPEQPEPVPGRPPAVHTSSVLERSVGALVRRLGGRRHGAAGRERRRPAP